MRRRSIFLSGHETQINSEHQEELSNEIDQNLRTLALIHPFSDIAKPLLVKVHLSLTDISLEFTIRATLNPY